MAEFGQYLLIISLMIATVQFCLGFASLMVSEYKLQYFSVMTKRASFLQVAMLGTGFVVLVVLFSQSDFSVRIISEHSHSQKPIFYKIAATWGNHEGSILLFTLIISLMGALLAFFGGKLNQQFLSVTLGMQGLIAVAMIGFTIFTSNPFDRLTTVPLQGNNLNPLLQDWALAVHPPLLYLGYVGLSIPFSFAISALILGKIDDEWAKWVRPWALFAWACLTGGITLGSFWAYYELGWGGFWFWDPVENASLMPWLAATALLHSAIVMEKRRALGSWTILLAIVSFGLSLLGTFLVRSGILTSVHAFAVDPKRGLAILGILFFFIGGALTLYAFRGSIIKPKGIFSPISREGALLLNNLFLAVMLVTVFIGTLYPLFVEAISENKISVGAPYFNQTFIPLAVPMLVLMPIGTMFRWRKMDISIIINQVFVIFLCCLFLLLVFIYLSGLKNILAWVAVLLGIWIILTSIWSFLLDVGVQKRSWIKMRQNLIRIKFSKYGVFLAHTGVGVLVLGLSVMGAWKIENTSEMTVGDTMEVSTFSLEFLRVSNVEGPNFNEIRGDFLISKNGDKLGEISTSRRKYFERSSPTTEVGLFNHYFSQVYIAFGQLAENNKVQIRAYYNPLVIFIWIGPMMMMFGGFISLLDRRNRGSFLAQKKEGKIKKISGK